MSDHGKLLYTEVSPFPDGRRYSIDGWREIPEIVHDDTQIKGFFGDYRWLSNFETAVIVLDGVTYDSVEKAYQAAKWKAEDRQHFQDCTNKEAIKYNREHTPNGYTTEEWNARKIDVMRFLLQQKFDPGLNPDNSALLIATGDRYLEETNWWKDAFWGKTLAGVGDNHLGQLQMEIRTSLLLATGQTMNDPIDNL